MKCLKMFLSIPKHLSLSDPSNQTDFLINDDEVVLNEDDIELPAFRKIFTKVKEEEGKKGKRCLKKIISHQIQFVFYRIVLAI